MSFVKSSLKGKNIKMKNKEYLTKKKEWSKFSTYKVFVKGNRIKTQTPVQLNHLNIGMSQMIVDINPCYHIITVTEILKPSRNKSPVTLSKFVVGPQQLNHKYYITSTWNRF